MTRVGTHKGVPTYGATVLADDELAGPRRGAQAKTGLPYDSSPVCNLTLSGVEG